MSLRTTHAQQKVLGLGAYFRSTAARALLLGQAPAPGQQVTSLQGRVLGFFPLNSGVGDALHAYRLSHIAARILVPRIPDFRWLDMMTNEVFPYDISQNSIGATRFQTDVVRVDSGHDQRTSRWDQPLMEYDVAYGVRTMEQLHGLIAFFRAMRGKRDAFLYHDHVDHTSSVPTEIEARRAPEIRADDQVIGIGDYDKYRFQLIKTYQTPYGDATQARPIYRPKPDTVMVAVDGVEASNWVLDETTGVITFTPPYSIPDIDGVTVTISLGNIVFTAAAGTFSEFDAGEKVVPSGFANPINNLTIDNPATVLAVSGGGAVLTLSYPAGLGVAEASANNVSIYKYPAPASGTEITAGFEFWVPVRFDTDRLPVSLEEYGVGGAADVKLIEVRPSEVFDE